MRREAGTKLKEISVMIPEVQYDKLYLILLDPFTSRPRYGAMSRVAEELFDQFIKDVVENGLPAYLRE